MTFQDAVKTCLAKYADFSGSASRSEYWYFMLFLIIASFALGIVMAFLDTLGSILYGLFWLGMIIPSLSAATRRLHDTGRSGWWQLIGFIPFIGIIVLLVFLAQPSQAGDFE